MKILFVCGGGVIYGKEITTLSSIKGLREKGHDVRCITSTWGNAFAKRLDALLIPYVRVPLGFISKVLRWDTLYMTFAQLVRAPELWKGYHRYVKDFDPDIIIHTNFHHLLLLWPFLDPKRTVFRVHDYFEPKMLYRCLIKFLGMKLRAFIGVSNFIRNSIIQLGISESKAFSVLNGAEALESNGPQRSNTAIVTVGIVGQVAEWKGHDDLIEALRILKSRQIFPQCIIFGEGDPSYVNSLRQKIDRYGLQEKIHLSGYEGDRQRIYSQIDICVLPSRCQDPCPIVAIEAQYFGIPVIAARRGGVPEIILDGKTGYLVNAQSPHEIAERLERLIENPDLRKKMGDAARIHASQHFTLERMVQEIEDLLLTMAPVNRTHV